MFAVSVQAATMHAAVLTLFGVLLTAANWQPALSVCTGEVCCSYPNEGIGCDAISSCKYYGGSAIGMCDTQCNCGGLSLEKAAVEKIGTNNCTSLRLTKSGELNCHGPTLDSMGDDDPHLYPHHATVAYLSPDITCPAFMHAVWSANGLICVANQVSAKATPPASESGSEPALAAAAKVPPAAVVDAEAGDPDCQQECCMFKNRIACLPNCSGIGQRVSCAFYSAAPLLDSESDDPPACYTCFLPNGSEACSTAAGCMKKGGNPVLGCNSC